MHVKIKGIRKHSTNDYKTFDDSSLIKSSNMPHSLSLRDGFPHPPIQALLILCVTVDFPFQPTLKTLSSSQTGALEISFPTLLEHLSVMALLGDGESPVLFQGMSNL